MKLFTLGIWPLFDSLETGNKVGESRNDMQQSPSGSESNHGCCSYVLGLNQMTHSCLNLLQFIDCWGLKKKSVSGLV